MRRKRRKAFTIVEVLVVIILLGMIATLIVPKMFKGLEEQKRKIAKAQIANIETAIERFHIECGRYPMESEQFEVLLVAPSDVEEGKWKGPYLKQSQLSDPWDRPYIYREEGEYNPSGYDVICYGADGAEGGEGDDEERCAGLVMI